MSGLFFVFNITFFQENNLLFKRGSSTKCSTKISTDSMVIYRAFVPPNWFGKNPKEYPAIFHKGISLVCFPSGTIISKNHRQCDSSVSWCSHTVVICNLIQYIQSWYCSLVDIHSTCFPSQFGIELSIQPMSRWRVSREKRHQKVSSF